MEVIVQLFICFICITMGSDKQIRKLNITLDLTIPGAPKLVWTRKLSVGSEIEAPENDFDERRSLSHVSVNSDQ